MATAMIPEVLTDPIGLITDRIASVEPNLAPAKIEAMVTGLAGGRTKQRRLAQALHDNPELLTTGRSPAPRALGDLLIALYKAGATRTSLPSCAECGKLMRSLQRRGQDWYCSACGPSREPCTSCGITRVVTFRDRQGGARCPRCPSEDDRDPVEIVIAVVARIDPTVKPEVVARAVRTAVPRAGQRYRLAWALEDRPALLTGDGAQAPIPSVLRLIDQLCEAGSQAIIHPACPHCRRVIHLHRSINGQWLCRTCVARTRAQPCSRCKAVREAATRDDQGRPLCPYLPDHRSRQPGDLHRVRSPPSGQRSHLRRADV